MDTGHARPGQGVRIKQLPKELGHIAEFISLQAMHCAVLWGDGKRIVNLEILELCQKVNRIIITPVVGRLRQISPPISG